MVSGHGVKGGRGRCYGLWQDFVACMDRHKSTSLGVCQHQREDYLECLHHPKLVSRLWFPRLASEAVWCVCIFKINLCLLACMDHLMVSFPTQCRLVPNPV